MKHKNKHECPFLHRNNLCTHKQCGSEHMVKKIKCPYKDCNKCGLYNEFIETNNNYINSIKAHQEAFK